MIGRFDPLWEGLFWAFTAKGALGLPATPLCPTVAAATELRVIIGVVLGLRAAAIAPDDSLIEPGRLRRECSKGAIHYFKPVEFRMLCRETIVDPITFRFPCGIHCVFGFGSGKPGGIFIGTLALSSWPGGRVV